MKKIIKGLLIVIVFLLIICFCLAYYLLGTNHGLNQLVNLGNKLTDYQISSSHIEGNLFSGSKWQQLSIKGEDLAIFIDDINLDWEINPFANEQLKINHLIVNKVKVKLPKSKKEAPTNKSVFPIQLDDVNIPINTQFDQIDINNWVIQQHNQPDIIINKLTIKGNIHSNHISINQLSVDMPQLSYIGSGDVSTKNNWPINLDSQIDLKHLLKEHSQEQLSVKSSIKGEIKTILAIKAETKGIADLEIQTNASKLLVRPDLEGNLVLKNITSKLLPASNKLQSNITFNAMLDEKLTSQFDGQIHYDSPETNAIKFSLNGEFKENEIQANMLVDLLKSKQRINSFVNFNLNNQQILAEIESNQFHFPMNQEQRKNNTKQASIKDFKGQISGNLNNYQINVSTIAVINELQKLEGELGKKLQEIPVNLIAKGNTESIDDLNLNILINKNPLTITGKAKWLPELSYQMNMLSKSVSLGDQYPQLDNVDVVIAGLNNEIDILGKLSVSGASIPVSHIQMMIDGDYTKAVSSKLIIDTLGGQINSDIYSEVSPLKLSGTLHTKKIKPQQLFSGIKGNINTKINFEASQQSGHWFASIVINKLSGVLQKLPLKGSGLLSWDGKNQLLDFSKLDILVMGNQIQADGQLSVNNSSTKGMNARINAKELNKLYPDLSGQMSGDIAIKGSLLKPQGKINLIANQLRFKDNKLKALSLKADVDLSSNLLDIAIKAGGLEVNQQKINTVIVNAKGKFSNHQLNVDLDSDLGQLELKGISAIDMTKLSWKSKLNHFLLATKPLGKWKLKQSSSVFVSQNKIIIDSFCLQQKNTNLCVEGKLNQGNGLFDVALKEVSLKQFKPYLPSSLKTNAVVSASANIKLNQYQPNIKGKIEANKANVEWFTGGGGKLKTKIEQLSSLFAFRDNRLETRTRASLSDLGKVDLKVLIPNINQSKLASEIDINIPSIRFLEKLLPQLSNVTGNAKGKVQVLGDWNKKLTTKGSINFSDGQLHYPQYGTEIRNIKLSIFAEKGNRIGIKGSATSGKGELQLTGVINPITRRGNVNIVGSDFSLANSKKLKLVMNPNIEINIEDKVSLKGKVLIPSAFIVPELSQQSKITTSSDVVILSKNNKPVQQTESSSPIEIDLAIDLGNDIKVSSADIGTKLNGRIKLKSIDDQPISATGSIEIETGDIRVYGQELTIERGRIIFDNGPIDNPSLDIRASREIEKENVTVGVNVLGPVSKPELSLFSVPSLSDSSIFSYLLFGRPPNSDSFGSSALLQTLGTVGTNAIAGDVRSSVGLDVLDVSLSSFEAGKNFGKKLYLGLYRDFIDEINQLLLQYKFSGRTTLDAGFSSEDISLDLMKKIETN